MRKKVFLLLLVATGLVFLSGCDRDPIDVAEFQSIMEGAGYEVVDITHELDTNSIRNGFLAIGADYQYELYEFIDVRDALVFFNNMEGHIESMRGGSASTRTTNVGNHSRFELTSGGIYSQVYRVENVVIFVTADADHRSAIREMMRNF